MKLSKLASKNAYYVLSDGCCFFLLVSIANDYCLVDTVIKELVAIMDCLLITMCLSGGGISPGSVYLISHTKESDP